MTDQGNHVTCRHAGGICKAWRRQLGDSANKTWSPRPWRTSAGWQENYSLNLSGWGQGYHHLWSPVAKTSVNILEHHWTKRATEKLPDSHSWESCPSQLAGKLQSHVTITWKHAFQLIQVALVRYPSQRNQCNCHVALAVTAKCRAVNTKRPSVQVITLVDRCVTSKFWSSAGWTKDYDHLSPRTW